MRAHLSQAKFTSVSE